MVDTVILLAKIIIRIPTVQIQSRMLNHDIGSWE